MPILALHFAGHRIPARLVAGSLYGLEPVDLHAWFEAYVGGCWQVFDSTQDSLRGGRLAAAYGRDAAGVSVYHQYGCSSDVAGWSSRLSQAE